MTALPGAELVEKGIADLGRGEESVEALLVSIGAQRLTRAGYPVSSRIESPEERLYELLAEEDSDSAHSRYNALVRRLVSFERAAERAQSRMRPVDRAADKMCEVTEQLLNRVGQPVWGIDWDYDDEDSLRDTARAVERYRHWVATGEDDFIALRPGLEPHLAIADEMLVGIGSLLRNWDDYGNALYPVLRREVEQTAQDYWETRQEQGGKGLANVPTWSR